jgi:hypothetical protein
MNTYDTGRVTVSEAAKMLDISVNGVNYLVEVGRITKKHYVGCKKKILLLSVKELNEIKVRKKNAAVEDSALDGDNNVTL